LRAFRLRTRPRFTLPGSAIKKYNMNKRFISESVVLRSVRAGGNLNNGTNAGLAARNANNSLANN